MNVGAGNQLFTASAGLLGQVGHGELVFEADGVVDRVEALWNLTICTISFKFLRRREDTGSCCTLPTVLSGIGGASSCCLIITSAGAMAGLLSGVCCAIHCYVCVTSAGAMGGMLCRVCVAVSL